MNYYLFQVKIDIVKFNLNDTQRIVILIEGVVWILWHLKRKLFLFDNYNSKVILKWLIAYEIIEII